MWVTEEVSLVEFYESGLNLARDAGYEVVLCFVAREADAPKAYDGIFDAWRSLDDLTGPKILFLFAGRSVREKQRSDNIYREPPSIYGQGRLLFSPDGALLSSKRMEAIRRDPRARNARFSTVSHRDLQTLRENTEDRHPRAMRSDVPDRRVLARHRPHQPRRSDIAHAQTSQIRELRNHLLLRESDVPCLHMTFLDGSEPIHHKLQPRDDVYATLKAIIETVESGEMRDLKSAISGIRSRQVSISLELQALRKKSDSPQKLLLNVLSVLRAEVVLQRNGAERVRTLEGALLGLVREPSEHQRRSAFDALKEARDDLKSRQDWRNLKSRIQRIIDLAGASDRFQTFADVDAAIIEMDAQRDASITRLEQESDDLGRVREAKQHQLMRLVSSRGIRERMEAALRDRATGRLDIFLVVAARQELDAIRSHLDVLEARRERYDLSDDWSAERIVMQRSSDFQFVLVLAPGQGVEDMAELLGFLHRVAQPKAVLLVGMMAGISGKSRLLDVQAPRNIVNGTRLGTRDGQIVAEPHGRDVDPVMHNRLQAIDRGRRGIADIPLVTHKHSICVSGKFDDLTPELALKALATDPENIVGIEMEGSALTARQAGKARIGDHAGYIMIKGVADYAGAKASEAELAQLRSALESSGIEDAVELLEDPDPTTNRALKSAVQKVATIRALRVALALIEEGQS